MATLDRGLFPTLSFSHTDIIHLNTPTMTDETPDTPQTIGEGKAKRDALKERIKTLEGTAPPRVRCDPP